MNTKRLRALAPDLNRTAPRSPRAPLGEDFPALAARLVDKCRAELAGLSGSYQYDCPLDRPFFAATGMEAGRLRDFIATGADDQEIASWMRAHARSSRDEIAAWGRRMRRNPLLRLLDFEDWVHRRRHAGATALDRIYAADFIGVGPSGRVRTKPQVISDFTSGDLKFQSITTDDVQVRVYGNTAVETGRSTMIGQDKGQTVPRDTRFTRVWVKQQGRWRLVANHYSSQTTRQ